MTEPIIFEPYGPDHCYFHGVDEPTDDDTFRVCLECCHVYQTEADLIVAANQAALEYQLGKVYASADEIKWCPLCIHDW
jgi:hypothetical protein